MPATPSSSSFNYCCDLVSVLPQSAVQTHEACVIDGWPNFSATIWVPILAYELFLLILAANKFYQEFRSSALTWTGLSTLLFCDSALFHSVWVADFFAFSMIMITWSQDVRTDNHEWRFHGPSASVRQLPCMFPIILDVSSFFFTVTSSFSHP